MCLVFVFYFEFSGVLGFDQFIKSVHRFNKRVFIKKKMHIFVTIQFMKVLFFLLFLLRDCNLNVDIFLETTESE